jgi:hypothetical protein
MITGVHCKNDEITAYGFDEHTEIDTNGVYDFMTPHGAIVKAQKHVTKTNGTVGYSVKI